MKLSDEKNGKLAREVGEKFSKFETDFADRLGKHSEIAEIFLCRPGQKKKGALSNPRLAEMFRAVRTVSTLEYRMLTSQKPFYELVPMDQLALENPADVEAMRMYVNSQVEISDYFRWLLRGLYSKNLFGTVFVERPYKKKIVNFLGREMGVTYLKPRSLLQAAFAPDSIDINEASWVAVSDIVPKSYLLKLKDNAAYDKAALQRIYDEASQLSDSDVMKQRLAASGYHLEAGEAIEIITYYGVTDEKTGFDEVMIEVVNRQDVIRLSELRGQRPVSIAYMQEFEAEPLGYGMGELFLPMHKAADAHRRKLTDLVTFSAYNMFIAQKGAQDIEEFIAGPWAILESEAPEAVRTIGASNQAISASTAFDMLLRDEFRAAAAAPDTLQAIPSGETATEIALASSAAIRTISVMAEMSAKPMVKDHIQGIIENGQKYVDEKLVVKTGGEARTILPSQFMIDVDVEVRTNTDTNFRPGRLPKLLQALQIGAQMQVPGYKFNPGPLLSEIFTALDVPGGANGVLQKLTPEDLAMMEVQALMQSGRMRGMPSGEAGAAPEEMITPGGAVPVPPGEVGANLAAAREAGTVSGPENIAEV